MILCPNTYLVSDFQKVWLGVALTPRHDKSSSPAALHSNGQ